MKNLNQLKEQLRNLLVKDGILTAIHSLKEQLPSQSPLLNQLTLIEKADVDLRQNVVKGIIGYTEIAQEGAKINNRFLALVEGLKAADFDRKIRRSSFEIQEKIKKGVILYRIPTQMQANEMSKCLVRVAFDKETILESLNLDKDTVLKENVKISRKMEVTLMDPTEAVFEIKAMNTKEQFVEIDDFTEWSFYVTPLKAGKHLLVLRVTIMIQMENGEWRRREKTLEESVVIVSEPLQDIAIEQFKKIQDEIIVSHSHLMAQQSGYRLPQNLRTSAMALLFIILSSVVTYAAIPAQVEFWAANIQGTSDAYENYIQRWEDASRENPQLLEKAYFQRAEAAISTDSTAKEKALEAYFDKYELQGQFSEKVTFDLAELKQDTALYEKYIQQFYEERTPRFEAALFAVAKIKKDDPTALERYEAEYGAEGQFAQAIEQLKVDRRDSLVAKSIRSGDTLQLQSLRQIYPDIKMDTSHIVNQRLANLGATLSLPTPNSVIEPQETEKTKTEEQQPKTEQEDKTIELADKDQDGIPDDSDKCPEEAGSLKLEGCPDTDEDGIIDKEDLCPLTYGLITMDGCPDSDADGVIDSEDECVTQYGPKATNGCPDADGDGIADVKDKCPDEKGTIENNGCPKVTPSEDTPSHSLPVPPTIFVPAGTFTMGCLSKERDGQCGGAEKPARTGVKVDAFYMGKYEVTNEEFAAFLNAEGNQEEGGSEWVDLSGSYKGVKCRIQIDGDRFVVEEGYEKHPIIYVSWYGAVAYCKWLSEQTGQSYRLPSEAEWEYAARGAEQGAKDNFLYSGSNNIDEVAWYGSNSDSKTHEVGKKKANQLGLYDMIGNVREWCADPWHDNYDNAPKDARVWEEGGNNSYRVLRGGSWFNYSTVNCRVAFRLDLEPYYRYSDNGFRVARDR